MEASNATAEQFTDEIPLFVSYLKMFLQLIAPFAIGIPAGLVIRVIVIEKQLHTKYYFILVNLLITDVVGVTLENLITFTATGIYILGIEIKINCVFIKSFDAPVLASQLLFVALGIDRFIAVAYPYRHRKLMSTKTVCSMIVATWAITIGVNGILLSTASFQYVHQLGRCYPLSGFPFAYLMKTFLNVASTVAILLINKYLYKKILESNKKHRENATLHGHGSVTNARKHEAKRDRLREHIKPVMSVLLLGGIDAAFNLLHPLIYILIRFILGNSSITRLYIVEFVAKPLQWCQLLCHPLVYGIYMTKIRQRIFDFELYHMIFSRRSKVKVINRNTWINH